VPLEERAERGEGRHGVVQSETALERDARGGHKSSVSDGPAATPGGAAAGRAGAWRPVPPRRYRWPGRWLGRRLGARSPPHRPRRPQPHRRGGGARTRQQAAGVPASDWLPRVLVVGDALIAGASVLLAYWYRHNLDFINPAARDLLFVPYLAAIPVAMAIYGFALFVSRQYRSWRGRTLVDQLLGLYGGLGLAVILVLAMISLTQTGALYSRLTITYSLVICAVAMSVERFVLREYETRLRRRGVGTERVLMVGTGSTGELLIRRMNMFPQYGYLCCGVADDQREIGSQFAGVSVVGRLDDLPPAGGDAEHRQGLPRGAERQARAARAADELCEDQRIDFRLVPDCWSS